MRSNEIFKLKTPNVHEVATQNIKDFFLTQIDEDKMNLFKKKEVNKHKYFYYYFNKYLCLYHLILKFFLINK